MLFSTATLYKTKRVSTPHILLLSTVISLSFSNLQYWLMDVGYYSLYNISDIVYIQFELLIVPLFYLFVRYYLQKNTSPQVWILVFFPFMMGMTYQFWSHFSLWKINKLFVYDFFAELVTVLYALLLIGLIYIDLKTYEKQNSPNTSTGLESVPNGSKTLSLLAYLFVCSGWEAHSLFTLRNGAPSPYFIPYG